jgi:7,8-dihydropterin-6-yl-methyl-4-(beta-D-ribofuranosyl)aminobenzene 5'-phosphate synthase
VYERVRVKHLAVTCTILANAMTRVKKLKVTTVGDNLVYEEGHGQPGLSLLLELVDARGDDRKIIFDTGDNKEALIHNINLLKLNLRHVDAIVLSHGHCDHTRATVEVVEAAGGIKIYGHPQTFIKRFIKRKGKRSKNIGVPKGEGIAEIEKAGGEVVLSTKPTEVVPGLWTTGEIERRTFETVIDLPGGGRLVTNVYGREVEDRVLDDLALWTDVKDVGPFVVTGCAHSGAVNTLRQVQRLGSFNHLCGLIGGTHLWWRSDKYVQRTIRELKRFGFSVISPCHCTGWKANTWIRQAFPKEFILNYCYRVIEAGKRSQPQVW